MESGRSSSSTTRNSKDVSGCWPSIASSTTQLMLRMILAWSTASHLACWSRHESMLTDAGVPGQGELHEEELEEMFPFEPLWDLLLPLTGLSVGAIGVQLTLGLSLAEPLLLLMLPNTRGALRGWHDRLLSWHLGGLFGQPMVLAQLAVARAELQHHSEDAISEGCATAAVGSLVGVYAAGAMMGSAIQRAVRLVWNGSLDVHSFRFQILRLRHVLVLLLVLFNLHAVVLRGKELGSHHAHAREHGPESRHGDDSESTSSSSTLDRIASSHEETTPLNNMSQRSAAGPRSMIGYAHPNVSRPLVGILDHLGTRCIQWFLEKSQEAWYLLIEEFTKILKVAWSSKDIIAARSLMVLGLTVVVGPTPLPQVDFFEGTPLKHGFSVMWFDAANVITAGIFLPIVVAAPLQLPVSRCLDACYAVAVMVSMLAFVVCACTEKDSFREATIAGMLLAICTAFANAVLAMRTVKRTASNPGASAVALSLSLLGSSMSQVVGPELGGVIYQRASWEGVMLVAALACMMSFFAATRADDIKRAQ